MATGSEAFQTSDQRLNLPAQPMLANLNACRKVCTPRFPLFIMQYLLRTWP
jgi:hypothetical protein